MKPCLPGCKKNGFLYEFMYFLRFLAEIAEVFLVIALFWVLFHGNPSAADDIRGLLRKLASPGMECVPATYEPVEKDETKR